jgi:hypothetical protein
MEDEEIQFSTNPAFLDEFLYPDNVNISKCANCHSGDFAQTEGFLVCTHCGMCVDGWRALSYAPDCDKLGDNGQGTDGPACTMYDSRSVRFGRSLSRRNGKAKDEDLAEISRDARMLERASRSAGVVCTKGRYKHRFHWNERISQMRLSDPPLPKDVEERIQREADSGKYGPREHLSRATVITILRRLGISNKYRERWKSILRSLNGKPVPTPTSTLIDRAEVIQAMLENRFSFERLTMPKSATHGTDNKGEDGVLMKDRHNFLSFNYTFRKMMEAIGINIFHFELPVVRSATKLHNLDDVMERMADAAGLPFERSAVVQRHKVALKE